MLFFTNKRGLWRWIIIAGAVALLSIVMYASFVWYQLPVLDNLNVTQLKSPLRIYTEDEKLMAVFGEVRRETVKFENIPQPLINAIISAEDDEFFEHSGVDFKGMLRAVYYLLRDREFSQGGSTITMQVARNYYLSQDKKLSRKFKEILLAWKIESQLGKNQILELYINKIYLGNRAYGFSAAAQVYYGVPLENLSIPQFAMLAGLPKAPSTMNPIANPRRALQRRNYVLNRMRELGYLEQDVHTSAIAFADNAQLHGLNIEVEAPHVAEMVRQEAEQLLGESAFQEGYRVYTTVNSKLQLAANKAFENAIYAYDHRHGYRGPLGRLDIKEVDNELLWESELYEYEKINHLLPAVVTKIHKIKNHDGQDSNTEVMEVNLKEVNKNNKDTSENIQDSTQAQLYVKGGRKISINDANVAWACKDNSVEPSAGKISAIECVLKEGDIVYIDQRTSNLSQLPVVQGAMISVDPGSGAIRTLIGGHTFSKNKFNRVIQARRQPGSSFKPFIYSAALEKGFTAASIVNDAPIVKQAGMSSIWTPENASGKYLGPIRLRLALAKSRNVVAVRVLEQIGMSFALEHIEKFGFDRDELPRNLTLALGSGEISPMELSRGYSVFANGGYLIDPYLLNRIENKQGETIYNHQLKLACDDCPQIESPHVLAPRVISAENAFIMTNMMKDVIEYGTAKRARILKRNDLAGKTGTTNQQRDAWFAGFHPSLVTVSWVGFDDPASLGQNEFGGRTALPMWIDVMDKALDGVPEKQHILPGNMVNIKIDKQTGLLACDNSNNSMFEIFRNDYVPARQRCDNQETADTTEIF